MMKILAGAVCRQDPTVFQAHLQTMRWQDILSDVEVDLLYIDDNDDPETSALLEGAQGVRKLIAGPRPNEAKYEVVEQTHKWSDTTFAWLAKQKQRILNIAVEEEYDAVFLCDTDLLLDQRTIRSLLDAEKPITSAVFWTAWQQGSAILPQVWLKHPYGLEGRGLKYHEFMKKLARRNLQQVWGLGACTLVRTSVLDRVGYYPLLEGLPSEGMWQGEDRTFCIRAERAHVEMFADAWPDVWHCYRPSDREDLEEWLEELPKRSQDSASLGDLVNFTIEPLEEPKLAGFKLHVRGRLGRLDILPEIEQALYDLDVREEKLVQASFPEWYPIPPYRGGNRLMRVRLLDAKPYNSHPGLEQWNLTMPSQPSSSPSLTVVQ